VIDEVSRTNVHEIHLVLGHQSKKVAQSINDIAPHANILINDNYLSGHTSSIQYGMSHISDEIDAVMICLGDMPLIMSDHYGLLINHYIDVQTKDVHAISRPMVGDIPGHPVILSMSYAGEMMTCSDKDGCRSVIQQNKAHLYPYASDSDAFIRDIDDQKQYEELLSRQ